MSEYIYGSIGDPLANVLGEIYLPRVEVVRCRNCKDYRESDETCHSSMWHNWDFPIEVEPDGFCAWGERRTAIP